MAGDVSLTGSTLLVVSGLLTALTGAIGLLFRMLMKAKEDQIEYLQRRVQYLEEQSDQSTDLAEVATRAAKQRGRSS